MDVENNNIIKTEQTRDLPLQQFQLPYTDVTPASSRIVRQFNNTEVNGPILPAELYPLRNFPETSFNWTTENLPNIALFNKEFSYNTINQYISKMVPKYLFDSHMAQSFALKFQVEIHQSMQHQGLLGMYWIPGVNQQNGLHIYVNTIDANPQRRLFYYNPTLITPQSNKAYEITIPLRQHWANFFTQADVPNYIFGTFRIVVVSRLHTMAEKTALPVLVNVRMEQYSPVKISGFNNV